MATKGKAPKVVEPTKYTHCVVCGKPLTRPESQESGYGPECEGKDPEALAALKEERTVETEPKGYVTLKQVFEAALENDVPRHRVMKAIGGNRGAGEPFSPNWEFVYYRNQRWLPKACLKELPKLAGESKPGPKAQPAAPKAKVAPKPKAAPKAQRESGPVSGTKTGKGKVATTRTSKPAQPASKASVQAKAPKKAPVRVKRSGSDGVPVIEVLGDEE